MVKIKCIFKIVVLFLILHFVVIESYAYNLVLPKNKKYTTSDNYALFVGKANNSEYITINDTRVYVAPNGAFTHSVKLKNGENRVAVRSDYNTQIFKINKKNKTVVQNSETENFDKKKYIVKKDNVPLRSTPIDAGLNRIAHLYKGTNLVINGANRNFYRVFLSNDTQAWIAKKDVEEVSLDDEINMNPATFIDMSGQVYKNANVKNITFSKNIPYTVEEKEKELLFKVYNPEMSDMSVYSISFPKPDKYYYNVSLENGKYTFKITEIPKSFEECTFVIDAGHGGLEKGAVGCLGDLEKDVNLKIALQLQQALTSKGAKVIMTRECDGSISLDKRVQIAKENDAEFFISIHHNSIGDVPFKLHNHRGTSLYYFNNNSKELAKILEKTITKVAGTKKNGIHAASFAVIRPTNYIGVLVETSYMINPLDSVLYNTEDYPKNVTDGIIEGLEEFIESK